VFGIFDLAFSNLVDPSIFIRGSFVVASRVTVAVPSEIPTLPQTASVRRRVVRLRAWCAQQATAAGSVRSGRTSACCAIVGVVRSAGYGGRLSIWRRLITKTPLGNRASVFGKRGQIEAHPMDSRLPNTDFSRRSIIFKVNLCFFDEYFARNHICFVRCSQLRERRASTSRRRKQLDDESSDDDDFFFFAAAATVQMLSKKKEDMVVRFRAILSYIAIEKPATGGCIKII